MKINPREQTIFGYEDRKSIEKIVSIMMGIVNGDDIPPVRLTSFNEGVTFRIDPIDSTDGGHHRCLAAYLLNVGLDFEVNFGKREDYQTDKRLIKIKNIKLISDPYLYLVSAHSNTRLLPTAEVFFSKYARINDALKRGKKNYSFTKRGYQKILEGIEEYKQGCLIID